MQRIEIGNAPDVEYAYLAVDYELALPHLQRGLDKSMEIARPSRVRFSKASERPCHRGRCAPDSRHIQFRGSSRRPSGPSLR